MVGRKLRIPTIVASPFFAYELSKEAGGEEFRRNLLGIRRILG